MNSKDIVKDFVRIVKADKQRSKYLYDISKDYPAEEMFVVFPDGDIQFNFIPFIPVSSVKLSNGGKVTVEEELYNHDKNGYIHNVTRIPRYVITPSGCGFTDDCGHIYGIDCENGVEYDDILDLTKKPSKSLREKKLIREIRETAELARQELINIADAYNYYNDLGFKYIETMHSHRTPRPAKRAGGIRVDVRRMF